MYTHSPVARTFFCCTVCLRTSAHLHACHTAWLKAQVSVKKVFACVSLISPSRFLPLMIHPSSLLFLHGHFETNPDYDLTADSDIHMILPYFPVLKVQEMRHSALAIAMFGYLTRSDANTGYEPKEFDMITPWIMTRCSSTIRSTISPTSRKPRTRTLNSLVFPQCLNPLFRSVLMMILLFRWKAKHAVGKPLLDREK